MKTPGGRWARPPCYYPLAFPAYRAPPAGSSETVKPVAAFLQACSPEAGGAGASLGARSTAPLLL